MQDDMLSDFLIEVGELFAKDEDALLVIEKNGDYQKFDAPSCRISGILEKPCDSKKIFNTVEVYIERCKAFKLLNKSIDLLISQFYVFDNYLYQNIDLSKRDLFRVELKSLLKQKKILLDLAQ